MTGDNKAGKERFTNFLDWFEEQGAGCVGAFSEGVGGDGRRFSLYRYRARIVILVEFPRGRGFDVYAPVTDENSVEAVKQALLALPDPAAGRGRKEEAAVAVVADLEDRGCPDGALDELVHDAKGEEAADINNGGLADQVEYLLGSGCTTRDILAAVAGDEDEDGEEG